MPSYKIDITFEVSSRCLESHNHYDREAMALVPFLSRLVKLSSGVRALSAFLRKKRNNYKTHFGNSLCCTLDLSRSHKFWDAKSMDINVKVVRA